MDTKHAVFVGLLVLLVIALIMYYKPTIKLDSRVPSEMEKERIYLENKNRKRCNKKMIIDRDLERVRGMRNDGYNQGWSSSYYGRRQDPTPEQLSEAEREQWYEATDANYSNTFNTEVTSELSADTCQYHVSQPAGDYSGGIVDLIIDPHTKDSHNKWVSGMKGWTGGMPRRVDDMDEAIEASINFTGLRRAQPISQYSPLFVTEIDTETLASNKKFNFM